MCPRNSKNSRKLCGAVTKNDLKCQKRVWIFSNYCWHHQDLGSPWVGIGGTVIGIAVGVAIWLVQERHPKLSAECYLSENENPCELVCSVKNVGRIEARDVLMSFRRALLKDTRVQADPIIGAELIEAEFPPDPERNHEMSWYAKAFSVKLPRVAPGRPVSFRVVTLDADNIRACSQVMKIRSEIIPHLSKLGERIRERFPEESHEWNFELLSRHRKKAENMFWPALVSYEEGQESVGFFTDDEERIFALHKELFSKYKQQPDRIGNIESSYLAPVFRTITSDGEHTLMVSPPYLRTCTDTVSFSKSELARLGTITLYAPVPQSYEKSCPEKDGDRVAIWNMGAPDISGTVKAEVILRNPGTHD